jgi:hypothetical protein
LWLDLRRCCHMDSTFIGTLLFLKRAADRRGPGRFAVVSPSPECGRIMEQIGVAAVLPILTTAEPPDQAWTVLPEDTHDMQAFQQCVVKAHQELADLGGAAGEPFRAVARCLAAELKESNAR